MTISFLYTGKYVNMAFPYDICNLLVVSYRYFVINPPPTYYLNPTYIELVVKL